MIRMIDVQFVVPNNSSLYTHGLLDIRLRLMYKMADVINVNNPHKNATKETVDTKLQSSITSL